MPKERKPRAPRKPAAASKARTTSLAGAKRKMTEESQNMSVEKQTDDPVEESGPSVRVKKEVRLMSEK